MMNHQYTWCRELKGFWNNWILAVTVPFEYGCQLIWLSKDLKDFQKYILILNKLFMQWQENQQDGITELDSHC